MIAMYACTTDNIQYKYSSGSSPTKTYHPATLRSLKHTYTHAQTPSQIAPHARTHTQTDRETDTKHSNLESCPLGTICSEKKTHIFLLSPAFGCCAHRSYGKTVDSVIHTFEYARCIVSFRNFSEQRCVTRSFHRK